MYFLRQLNYGRRYIGTHKKNKIEETMLWKITQNFLDFQYFIQNVLHDDIQFVILGHYQLIDALLEKNHQKRWQNSWPKKKIFFAYPDLFLDRTRNNF